jgi:hypothetical protein
MSHIGYILTDLSLLLNKERVVGSSAEKTGCHKICASWGACDYLLLSVNWRK